MADRYEKSFTRRPESPEPSAPRAPSSQHEDDPLVELARIVSGNQSFDDIVGRTAAQPAAPARQAAPQPRAAARDFSFDLESELLNDLQSSFDPNVRAQPQRAAAPDPAPRAAPQPPSAQDREAFDDMRLRSAAPPPPPPRRAAAPAQAASWTSRREPQIEEDPYAGTAYAAGQYEAPPADPFAGRAPAAPQAAEPPPGEVYEDDYYYEEPGEPGYDDGEYGDGRYADYDGYDAEPPRRSRKLLISAAIVLAIVLAGGLVALALKGSGTTTASDGAPKVIAADDGPTKVEPAVQPSTNNGQENKLIFDRANPDASPQEQLVLPDDGAIDAAPSTSESAGSREISRIILPGAPGDSASDPGGTGADGAAADDDGSVPRKVRTVVIKPDGTIVSSEARAKGAAPDAPAATTDVADASPVVTPEPDNAAPAAAQPEPEPTPAPAASAQQPAPVQKDTSQLEAPAPVAPAPKAVARPAPAASASGGGGFVVQVTAQRSQEQAAAAYQSLQRKFPSILGGHSPDIVRADLGAKGVYYRARVGPMATRDQAISLCEALKAAGGDCLVQKY